MKKVLSILLVMVLAFAAVPFAANAVNEPAFSLSNASGKAGDEVTVNLSIANNPGITALDVKVGYSASDVEIVKIEKSAETFADWTFTKVTGNGLKNNPVTIYMSEDTTDSTDNGVVATITLKLLDGAKTSDLTLTVNDAYNVDLDDVSFTANGSTITVEAEQTPTEPETTPAAQDGYYIVGSMNDWTVFDAYKLSANTEAEGEYYFTGLAVAAGAEMKVVYSADGTATTTWYPGEGSNYKFTTAGTYDVYFRPDYNGGDDWYYKCFYVAAQPTAEEKFEDAVTTPLTKADDDTFGNIASFKSLEMLGIQEKAGASDIRFVTAVSKDILNDANVVDYGYVVTKTSKSKADAEASIGELTPAVAKFSCKGTACAVAGAYGDGSKDYSYVTFGVNNIPTGKCVVARFYVQTQFETVYYYAKYGEKDGIVYTVDA